MSNYLQMNINILKMLEKIRLPFFDVIFNFITNFAAETVTIVVVLIVLWCIDKKKGHYLLMMIFINLLVSQFLKIIFRVSRPWVLDETFTIVEAARAGAGGYSFPSSHSSNAVAVYCGISKCIENKKIKFGLVGFACLIIFSRMYLGVHTPSDVLTSAGFATLFMFALFPIYKKDDSKMKVSYWILLTLLALAFMLFAKNQLRMAQTVSLMSDEELGNFKSAFELSNIIIGVCLACIAYNIVEDKYIKFKTDAVWWAQLLKLAIGIVFVLSVKAITMNLFAKLFGYGYGEIPRYFLVIFTGGLVYPLTFKYFSKLGRNND